MQKIKLGIYRVTLSGLAVLGAVLVSLTPGTTRADRFLGQQWASNQLVSINRISHEDYNALLKRYVDANGYVNYKAWHASRTDRARLQNYLKQLSRANPRLAATKEAKLAYWINAYNAVTLEGILQVYPTTSIRNHTAKLVGYNIWKQLKLRVADQTYSLEAIEHNVLRKMGEPRIHFAIVCASIGCPRLKNEAYLPSRLEAQLAENAKDFFSRSQNIQVDARRSTLKLSSLLSWYGGDFGSTQSQQLQYLARYMPESVQQLIRNPNLKISYLDYDWRLNAQSNR